MHADTVEARGHIGLGPLLEDMQAGRLASVLHRRRLGRAQQVGDQVQLLNGCGRLEEYASVEQLGKDAPHRPHVDRLGIVARAHQQLRGPIVLGDHLLGHVAIAIRLLHPGETEITNLLLGGRERANICLHCWTKRVTTITTLGTWSSYLKMAVAVHQQIPRLDITMQNFRRMYVLEATKDLVQEHLDMVRGQGLRRDDNLVQVALHQLGDYIAKH